MKLGHIVLDDAMFYTVINHVHLLFLYAGFGYLVVVLEVDVPRRRKKLSSDLNYYDIILSPRSIFVYISTICYV